MALSEMKHYRRATTLAKHRPAFVPAQAMHANNWQCMKETAPLPHVDHANFFVEKRLGHAVQSRFGDFDGVTDIPPSLQHLGNLEFGADIIWIFLQHFVSALYLLYIEQGQISLFAQRAPDRK